MRRVKRRFACVECGTVNVVYGDLPKDLRIFKEGSEPGGADEPPPEMRELASE